MFLPKNIHVSSRKSSKINSYQELFMNSRTWFAKRILEITPDNDPLPEKLDPKIPNTQETDHVCVTWHRSAKGNEYFNFGKYNVVLYKIEDKFSYRVINRENSKVLIKDHLFDTLYDCKREAIRNSILKQYPKITNVKSISKIWQ